MRTRLEQNIQKTRNLKKRNIVKKQKTILCINYFMNCISLTFVLDKTSLFKYFIKNRIDYTLSMIPFEDRFVFVPFFIWYLILFFLQKSITLSEHSL